MVNFKKTPYSIKDIEKAELDILKSVDAENKIDEDMHEKAEYIASLLTENPYAKAEIGDKTYVFMAVVGKEEIPVMQIIARPEEKIITPNTKRYKAKFVIDTNYTKRENLVAGITAIIGHITGRIKAEVLE